MENFFVFLSVLGSSKLWFGICFLLLFFYFFFPKKRRLFAKLCIVLIPTIFITYYFVFFLKLWLHIPRPCVGMEWCPNSYSFPSGHVATLFAVFGCSFFWTKNKKLKLLLFLLAVLVSYSRIALGVHRTIDVVGGAVLGFSVASLYRFFYTNILLRKDGYLLRKVIHMSSLSLVPVYVFLPRIYLILAVSAFTVFIFISELMRSRKKHLPFVHDFTLKCIKSGEERFALSPCFYAVSLLFILLLPFKNFYSGLIVLTVGDGLSGIFGHILRYKRKNLKRLLVFFFPTFLLLLLVLNWKTALLVTITTALEEYLVKDELENLVLTLSASLLAYI